MEGKGGEGRWGLTSAERDLQVGNGRAARSGRDSLAFLADNQKCGMHLPSAGFPPPDLDGGRVVA